MNSLDLCYHCPFSRRALVLNLTWSQLEGVLGWLGEREEEGLAEGLGPGEARLWVSSFLPFLLEMQMASGEESFQRMKAVFKKTLISSLTSF